MKYANSIKLSVFAYEEENSEDILKGLIEFFPFNLEENKVKINKTNTTSFSERKIQILEVILTKDNLIRQFLESLMEKLANQKEVLLEQLETRLDENLDFFIRFKKDYWIDYRKLALTDTGKCYHLKIGIAAFPKKRENAINAVKNIIGK